MRRFLAVATAIGLAVGAATFSADSYARESRVAPAITWGACTNAALAVRKAECGFLTVPLDHAKPGGTKIKLAVSRIRHTTPKSQGIMLVNPGGPGSPGLALAVLGESVPAGAGKAYDWIGLDSRGVGTSVPALTCDAAYTGYNRPPYVPSTKAIEKAWLARAAGYAAKCDKAGGALLDHLKTVDNVRDLESLRQALGEKQINFYGFSYGTYLGQVYATLHPERVRRMVLDGNVDPRGVWYRSNLAQNLAFEKTIKKYFAWLAAHDGVYHLGKTGAAVEKLFYATQAALAKAPAGGVIGPNELTDVFLQAGYYVFGWSSLADAFAAWIAKKDPKPLRALFDEANPQVAGSDNGYAVYLAVQCTDAKWPKSWPKWQRDNSRMNRVAPFETWGNAWFNAPCRTWGAKAGKPVGVTGVKAPPVLLVGETLDAATPFSGSLEVRKRFPRAALVEGVGGTTHAGSLFGNACVDNVIAAYLKTGALPKRIRADASDLKCKPLVPPAPAERASTSLSRIDLQKAIAGR
jgi:pimeloyl-ACP methyl ester carboxylesterase